MRSPLRRFAKLVPAAAIVLAAIVLAAIAAHAAELPPDFRAAIEKGVANGRYQGIAVALIERGDQGEWFFGALAPGGAAPTIDDAFEIGSTTRSFTGLLLARALVEGKLRLTDTLGRLFADVHFADRKLASATLLDVATHRAGLPPLPSNLFPRNIDNPYVDYDEAALHAYLAHASVVDDVGKYRYSDLGIALIGEAIARAYAKDFRTLIADDVLAPLAMKKSGFGAVPKLVDGYRDGVAVDHWQQQALTAAVGLRSTLGDLETFAIASLRPDARPLRASILLAREPRAKAGGGETALGWQIVPVESDGQNWPLLWQAGLGGGFASFIGLRTDRQRAVVLIGNAGVDLSALGLTLLAGRDAPLAPAKLRPFDRAVARAYEGLYRFDTGGDLVVRALADGIAAQVSGTLPQRIDAYDDDAFAFSNDAAQLTFERSGEAISGAILHQDGIHAHAARLSDGAPALKRNVAPLDAKSLDAYAGDYAVSPSMRARIVVAATGLRVQLTATAPTFVQSCAVDRFCDSAGLLEIAFTRDAKGKVTTLEWREGVFDATARRDDW
jgi:CubicO group peptidase (beta-lactamase class C family)